MERIWCITLRKSFYKQNHKQKGSFSSSNQVFRRCGNRKMQFLWISLMRGTYEIRHSSFKTCFLASLPNLSSAVLYFGSLSLSFPSIVICFDHNSHVNGAQSHILYYNHLFVLGLLCLILPAQLGFHQFFALLSVHASALCLINN